MGQCNFCMLRDIKKFAKDTGKKVTLTKRALTPATGEAPINGTDVKVGGVWAAWLMKIPKECVCTSPKTRFGNRFY